MEILNSGSFIPLDNRERIEQLTFTARTLADEVTKNDGFEQNAQTNQQIGLELWKGAEYVTRAHEEVTVRNIFLSKFLERLRDVQRRSNPGSLASPCPAPTAVDVPIAHSREINTETIEVTPSESAVESGEDEYLGVIESDEISQSRPAYADECTPDFERELSAEINAADSLADNHDRIESSQFGPSEVPGSEVVSNESILEDEQGINEPTPITPNQQIMIRTTEEAETVRSIVLTEKEPYNFEACTITAVVQLLPEVNGERDCVLSVRSHDFSPEITFSKVVGNSQADITAKLTSAFELYRSALPIRAAEKMKKEKSSGRKRTTKAVEKSSTTATQSQSVRDEVDAAPDTLPPNQAKDQQTLFAQ